MHTVGMYLDFPTSSVSPFPSPINSPFDSQDSPAGLSISCGDCIMVGSSSCGDCIVTYLCDGPAALRTVELDADEVRTLSLIRGAGLAPALRHRPRGSLPVVGVRVG